MTDTNELPDILEVSYSTGNGQRRLGSYMRDDGLYHFCPLLWVKLTSEDLGNILEGLNTLNIGDKSQ